MLFKTFVKYLKERKGAIHIGAHVGVERDWYKQEGFSPVLWFEPNKRIFEWLLNNLSGYLDNTAYCLGVHDTLKKAILHVASNKGQSSSILLFGTHALYRPDIRFVRHEEIELVRMDEFIKLKEIDITKYNFLNIDVQGVELNVLKSFGELLKQFDYIYTEVNEEQLYRGGCLVGQIDSYLEMFEFVRVETCMTKHKWGDAFYIKKSLLV